MPVEQLPLYNNIYPASVARLVVRSVTEGWQEVDSVSFEDVK